MCNKDKYPLFTWCNFNRLEINWSKTYAVFVHKKRSNGFCSSYSSVNDLFISYIFQPSKGSTFKEAWDKAAYSLRAKNAKKQNLLITIFYVLYDLSRDCNF
ncbi:hypothetical protein BpHYR1_008134 [Brachionus plicatilis]|uniref:Uncharacterized protein n=1 Tax=Brachionus plicatilis TaxID=10195 RepID=A0A3M7S2M0_BRAPC|nr:hypothetical protein BpHYR1_008134 [Brachionus plicatilis]